VTVRQNSIRREEMGPFCEDMKTVENETMKGELASEEADSRFYADTKKSFAA